MQPEECRVNSSECCALQAFFPPLLALPSPSSSEEEDDTEATGPQIRTQNGDDKRAPPRTDSHPSSHAHRPAPNVHSGTPLHITSIVTEGHISPLSIQVKVRERMSAEDFAQLKPNAFEPLLLSGETRGWPAHERWTFPFFSSAPLGLTRVTVTDNTGARSNLQLRDYLARFRDNDGHRSRAPDMTDSSNVGYLRGWTYELDNEALMDDFDVPSFAQDWFAKLPKREDPLFRWLFLGPAGAKTPLHVDPCLTHAWLAQIRGRKRFILYKPSHLHHLYDEKGIAADVRAPDRERYPTFDHATPFEVILQPGDLLFVPAGWAHQVECVDDSISLTHNFLPVQNYSAVRACLLANRLGKTVMQQQKRTVLGANDGPHPKPRGSQEFRPASEWPVDTQGTRQHATSRDESDLLRT